MTIEVISIGGELLAGQVLDSNFAWFARALSRVGLRVEWHDTVPDEPERLDEALRRAMGRADFVVTSGGLGATPDDLTRTSVARVLQRPLEHRGDVWSAALERYKARGLTLHESSMAMGFLPAGSVALPNPEGVAAGILLRADTCWVICLPGVPNEFRAMTDASVVPLLAEEMARRGRVPGQSRLFRTAGVSETLLSEALRGAIPAGIEFAWLPQGAGVDLKVSIPSGDSDLLLRFRRFCGWVGERFAPWIYGEGEVSLSEVVGEALAARGLTVAVAESLTGGAVTESIVQVPGASRYLVGSVVAYDDRVKRELLAVPAEALAMDGAVSQSVALALARGARERLGADVGLSTTGIAGPTGATAAKPVGLVWFGLASAGLEGSVTRRFMGGRDAVIQRSAQYALLLLHRFLRGQALDGVPFS